MADPKIIAETIVAVSEKILKNEDLQGMVCGRYSDGTPRSIPDALNGELMSPKEKKKAMKKIKKRKKKRKETKFKL